MRLETLKLWNFRKFGIKGEEFDLEKPDLKVSFTEGLNVLIGENDSGKTAIIDAIKLVLNTHSSEWITLVHDDFYKDANRLRIECKFTNLIDPEAKNFTEWLGMDGKGKYAKPYLKVILDASRNDDKILPFDIRAGADDTGSRLDAEAREYLRTTYLKPLRDAKSELIPRRNSRLSQILSGHNAFKSKDKDHLLMKLSKCWDCLFKKYFDSKYVPKGCEVGPCPYEGRFFSYQGIKNDGEVIQEDLQSMVESFLGNKEHRTTFSVIDRELRNILEQFKLSYIDDKLGLGSHNLLFMATELLNLKRDNWTGTRIVLIEELEAHIHPQSQMRVVEYLEEFVSNASNKDIQIILTTHSPNLASKVKLDNLIICHNKQVFPLRKGLTELEETDYSFLERFLDVTKANFFFAKGIILVEGWSEEILLPVLAKKVGINLTEKGISIVNIGNTAFLRYAKIFQRKDKQEMKIPVAVIRDLDIKPEDEDTKKTKKIEEIENQYNGQGVKVFISPHWTLEYCIALNDKFAPFIFKATKEAVREMRKDRKSISEITEIYKDISNNKTPDQIAFNIYHCLIQEKKVSKTIIAQHLAKLALLRKCKITTSELNDRNSTKYLIDAIQYACGI